ncbi:hypothetical protein, partial [Pseudomonas syringae group genomosp. 7]|uniref:hypothetical protein n=1 Tax=Pseudomonas syringae group genomosp. 7 TaxID=251699 RepID=UPI00376FD10F
MSSLRGVGCCGLVLCFGWLFCLLCGFVVCFGLVRIEASFGWFLLVMPHCFVAGGIDSVGLCLNVCTSLRGGHGVQHHLTSIVDPAVGVLETAGDARVERAV